MIERRLNLVYEGEWLNYKRRVKDLNRIKKHALTVIFICLAIAASVYVLIGTYENPKAMLSIVVAIAISIIPLAAFLRAGRLIADISVTVGRMGWAMKHREEIADDELKALKFLIDSPVWKFWA